MILRHLILRHLVLRNLTSRDWISRDYEWWQMTVRDITSVQILVAYGIEQGISQEDLLQGSDLVSTQLNDHHQQVEASQELTVLNNLLKYHSCVFELGVELGCRYQLTSYGIMGYALLASSTARKAIELALRYIDLTYAFSTIALTEIKGELVLTFNCHVPGKLGEIALIRDMIGAAMIQQAVFDQSGSLITLQFTAPQPADFCADSIKQRFGFEVKFNADFNGFVGLAHWLDTPLVKANEATAKICEAQCNELLQQKQDWKPTEKLVKETLIHLGLKASMADIADYLSRTTRTLHRQLKSEQTSWRQVRDNVRFGIAEELLLKPIPLEEIALQLGFSDGANFSHSFKRCKNMTPNQYRQQAKK
ncbi:transcriptional regulator [Shewanella sp. KT0246]|nr:transcriptional regulator [Shewanella sp. KT0246]